MRPVYAVQFELGSATSNEPLAFESVTSAIESWVSGWYRRWRGIELLPPFPVGRNVPCDDHLVETEHITLDAESGLWSCSWSYPPDYDTGLLWNVSATVARHAGRTEVSIVLRVGSREYAVSPPAFQLHPPAIVRTLVDRFAASLGGRRVTGSVNALNAAEIDEFVDWVRSPARRLPIVLFSRDPYSERVLASPLKVARGLVGLAEVWAMDDKWTSFRLTSHLGKPRSCFNGAVRIYWPGLDAEGAPRTDRPWMPEEVQRLGDAVAGELLARIAPVSAFRFVEMPTTRAVRRAVDAKRAEMLRSLADRPKDEQNNFEWLVKENEELLLAKQRAESELENLQLRNIELEERISDLEENVQALSAYTPLPPSAATSSGTTGTAEPTTVRDALEQAGARFTRLAIWQTAEKSAEACDFARPNEVLEALEAIAEIANRYFEARKKGGSMGAWDASFDRMGFKYSPVESGSTMGRFGREREFTHEGQTRTIQKHLTLGGGDRKNCMQIYFDVDDASDRFVVAYCGRHLPTDKYH